MNKIEMNQINSVKRLITLFFLALAFTALASCSSGGTDTSNNSPAGTGSVALLLTDAPSDIFEEINITVTRAELVSDSGNVTLFEGTRTFNLLDLTDARIFSIRDGIPAGSYSKIRLTLTGIELVDYKGTDDPADDDIFYPRLPANGKLDLNPRGSFDVVAGGTLAIQIDMDASKSIHIVKTGIKDSYQFRPVVFISIITDGFTERYVKLHGDVTGVNSDGTSFRLCNTDIPVQTGSVTKPDTGSGCIKVSADTTTSVFDINGKPTTLADLAEGEPATIFGRLKRERGHDYDDDDHDDEYKDSTRESKSRKGKHGDDESHKTGHEKDDDGKDDDDDDRDEHGDRDDDDRKMGDLILTAALIELGAESGFQKLKGKAASEVNVDDQFDMEVAPGQGLITPLTLNIQIQTGTIMINRKGTPIDPADISSGKLLSVRGVLDVTNDTLFASLIMVDTDSSSKLTGKVGDNPDSSCGFAVMTDTGDRSVATNITTKAFMVSSDSSTPIEISDLLAGQLVDVYGEEDSGGCFAAHTIIAY